jgi:threonine/homoserine/homoserine lactone efflux protein
MINFLLTGIILGIYSGFSPGPLLVLVVSQTLKHGYIEGVKVACAPVITDLPIILITLLFISLISGYSSILGVISILGGIYLGYMAYQSFKTRGWTGNIELEQPKSLTKGATVNFLNPSPYLFWITIGGPLLIQAHAESPLSAILFIIGFYGLLIGSKIFLAYFTGKSRDFLTGRRYIYIMRIIGLILVVFAIYFIINGIQLFGIK